MRSLLVLAHLACACAYECNVTLVRVVANVESLSMCGYVNYHVLMLLVFGACSLLFVLVAALKIVWYGPGIDAEQAQSVRQYVWWAFGCLMLMPGFEFVFVFSYVCVVCLVFASAAHCFLSRLSPVRLRSNAIAPSVVTVVVADDTGGFEQCSICLETGIGKPWLTTSCEHSFHLECIQKWAKGTCPLCRKRVWK